jgi:flavin-dependent dehydrogenase
VDRFDVIVIGGGVAGLATAIALRSEGYSVAVIERQLNNRAQIGEIFVPEVRLPLTTLDLWDDFLALGCAQAAARLSVWGSDRLDQADYVFNAYGNGWLVVRPSFDRMLSRVVVDRGVKLFAKARLQRVSREDNRTWRLTLSCGGMSRVVCSPFAVAATGRASSVLRQADETRRTYDRLVAIVARVGRPASWHLDDHRPLIEATADGWWFSLLFPDGEVHLAIMTDSDLARTAIRRAGSRPAMLHALLHRASHTRERLDDRLDLLGPPQVVAANTYINDRIVEDAKLFVGDAALAIDPLAGQGSFAALDAGIRAAEAVGEYFRAGIQPLYDYSREERRRFERYLADRTAYYRLEQRWPHSPFWKRRHADIARNRQDRTAVCTENLIFVDYVSNMSHQNRCVPGERAR